MDEFVFEIIKNFNLKPKYIKKLKYMYICQTDKGAKLLKPVNLNSQTINFIYSLKKHMENNEIFYTDLYYLSKDNFPFVKHNETIYVLTDYLDIEELDFNNKENIKLAIKSIAKFHYLSKIFNSKIEIKSINNYSILENWKKKLVHLEKIKKNVKKQKRLSEFDFLFIKNYDFFYKNAVDSIEILNKNIDILEENTSLKYICHNNLKEESILIKEKCFLTNFENICYNHYIFDLSDFILRYIRKKGDSYFEINEILEIYSKINNVDKKILKILYANLNFPERYINTCIDFYEKKRCFMPISISNQIESIINLKIFHKNYISKINIL